MPFVLQTLGILINLSKYLKAQLSCCTNVGGVTRKRCGDNVGIGDFKMFDICKFGQASEIKSSQVLARERTICNIVCLNLKKH